MSNIPDWFRHWTIGYKYQGQTTPLLPNYPVLRFVVVRKDDPTSLLTFHSENEAWAYMEEIDQDTVFFPNPFDGNERFRKGQHHYKVYDSGWRREHPDDVEYERFVNMQEDLARNHECDEVCNA